MTSETHNSTSFKSHVHFQMCTSSTNPCEVWRPVSHFIKWLFFYRGNFHPVHNPPTWKTTPQQLSVVLIQHLWSYPPYTEATLSATPWLVAWHARTLLLLLYCLPSLNMFVYSMLCTRAYETAWTPKIWSTHTRSYQSQERNLHEFTDAYHSAPKQHKRHSVHVYILLLHWQIPQLTSPICLPKERIKAV